MLRTVSACAVAERLDHAGPAARLVEWEPWNRAGSSLLGHATIGFSGGWGHRVPVFRGKDGDLSAGVPSIPELDAEGRIKERDAKQKYAPVVEIPDRGVRERISAAVIALIQQRDQ